jgi:exopolyphosphatase/guanosine-5'-triphosphate,3'-diphosphate pyrophosphatase
VLALYACAHITATHHDKCIVNRAALDIGSETTKIKVAKVDRCLQKNIAVIYKNEIKVPYAENLSRAEFNEQIREKGIIALQSLKNEAANHGAECFAGVATESFRHASNAPEYILKIKEKTGIPITLISQDQEAVAGFMAALSAHPDKQEKIVVWDIGGASMQITALTNDKRFIIYRSKTAAISFKERILAQIKRKKAGRHSSPNPIGRMNLDRVVALAMDATEDVPVEIREIIRRPDTMIIGIGGVHNESVRKQLGLENAYKYGEIIDVIKSRIDMNDKEIGGHYADTEISNLVLVYGFMKKLGIKEVIPVNVNLADGILIDPAFW